jgi:hypothetical protein
MTLFCQLSPYGKTLPEVTAEHPAYYVIHLGGLKEFGEVYAGQVSPSNEYMERMLTRALTVNGFLPAEADQHPPTLVLITHWGAHQSMDFETRQLFPEQERRQRLERARLVGGNPFLEKTNEAMEFGGPLVRDQRREFFDYQAAHDLYFAIVTAYDYAALSRGERKLVWRANLTVNGEGVNLAESLPPLVLSAGPVLGRDTTEPQIVNRRVFRTWVDLKETEFQAEPVPPSPPAAK